jgi:hypothetical protein
MDGIIVVVFWAVCSIFCLTCGRNTTCHCGVWNGYDFTGLASIWNSHNCRMSRPYFYMKVKSRTLWLLFKLKVQQWNLTQTRTLNFPELGIKQFCMCLLNNLNEIWAWWPRKLGASPGWFAHTLDRLADETLSDLSGNIYSKNTDYLSLSASNFAIEFVVFAESWAGSYSVSVTKYIVRIGD